MRAHASPRVVIVGADGGAISVIAVAETAVAGIAVSVIAVAGIAVREIVGFVCDRNQLSILGVLECEGLVV